MNNGLYTGVGGGLTQGLSTGVDTGIYDGVLADPFIYKPKQNFVRQSLITDYDFGNANVFRNNILDLSPQQLNGDIFGSVTKTSFMGGSALVGGSYSDYIRIPSNPTQTSFSLEIVYVPVTMLSTNTPLIYYYLLSSFGVNFFIRYNIGTTQTILFANHGGADTLVLSNLSHRPNNVYVMQITFNSTTRLLKVWINGVFAGSATAAAQLRYQGTMGIGEACNFHFLNYRIYNRDITDAEISQNYQVYKKRYLL